MIYHNEMIVFALGFALVALFCGGIYAFKSARWFAQKPRLPQAMLGDDMRGRRALIDEISPCGEYCFVTVGAERWRAQLSPRKLVNLKDADLKNGDSVRIKSVNGLTLNVCPDRMTKNS